MVDVLEVSMWMHEIGEHLLEVVVRWCRPRAERWLPRLACCVAMVIVCLGTPDADHGVQVKGFSWCEEWKQGMRYGIVSHLMSQDPDIGVRILASHDERSGLLLAGEDDLRGAGHEASSWY